MLLLVAMMMGGVGGGDGDDGVTRMATTTYNYCYDTCTTISTTS